jgi:hypothetical protein
MRLCVALVCVLALLFSACDDSGDAGSTESSAAVAPDTGATGSSSTTQVSSTTTTSTRVSTTTSTTTTTTAAESQEPPDGVEVTVLSDSVVLWDYPDEPASVGYLNGELAFTLVQSCGTCFAGTKQMTREPNGALTAEGWRAGVWSVGATGQTEINHLWPPDSPLGMDVLWLTDYTGMTEDTLTGFTPEPGETFTLWDEIVLETRTVGENLFGMHAYCLTGDDQIGAVLLSFEEATPVPLIGWTVDYDSMMVSRVTDPWNIEVGDCYEPAARP